jgi:16S rRNA (cytidine1402-2'-O)-methyltransferase
MKPRSGEPNAAAIVARAGNELERLLHKPLAPGLHVVATPIGNLGDVTLRALAALACADVLYCEDTRHSRTLLAHYGIGRPARAYHEHNAEREREHILAELGAGKSVALISDAGTPLVSDPGYKLVRAVLDAGHAVTALPGASAALAALGVAGLATDTFLFAGFLPTKQGARRSRLSDLKAVPATLVFFEAPSRVAASLEDMAEVYAGRQVAVARELTKLHESVVRGTADDLAKWAHDTAPKGEFVVLVGPPGPPASTDADIETALEPLLTEMSLADAARRVAETLAVPKARVYDIGLMLKRRMDRPI